MKKLLVALLLLAVVAAVAFAVRSVGARNEANKVDTEDARGIIEDGDGLATADGADEVDPGLRPPAGTYQYTGTGTESVDVLGGSRHDFPKQVPLVVQLDPDDECAWTSNLIYVKEHVERRSFCTTADGLADHGFTREIEFFNRVEEKTYECDDDAVRSRASAKPGDTWSWTCRDDGSETEATYTATVVAVEQLTIGGEPAQVTRTKVASDLTGETNGHDESVFWLLDDGLAAKFTTNLDVRTDSVLGETRFRERTSYVLDSLQPADES